MQENWRSVDGWLSRGEGAELRKYAAGERVLEFGCYKGKSAICMAAVADFVVTVDHFKGDYFASAGGSNCWNQAVDNVKASGYRDAINIVQMDFDRACDLLDLSQFGFIYYDADHTYEATQHALKRIHEKARQGVPIAVHDYERKPHFEGVIRAVDEFVESDGRAKIIVERLAVIHR